MAKYLIIYAGATGTTEKCAKSLQKKLISADILDADSRAARKADLSGYESVILGGSVRMDRIHPALVKFYRRRESDLIGKKLGVFLCCAFSEKGQELVDAQLPHLPGGIPMGFFGGELNFSAMKLRERLVARMALRSGELPEMEIDARALARFADAMLKALW